MKLRSIDVSWLWLVLALCILRLWILPLFSSFWVDEMATSFVVTHGANDATLRVAAQVPMSIYYALPRETAPLFGLRELGYRLPSLLAMLIALWLIGRIAAKLIHPDAAWFAVFACLALRGVNYQAADARPYALGTCMLCLSAWLLIRWLDSNRWLDGLLFALCASLLWRVHLVFWPFYLMFAAYAIVRLARRDTAVTWLHASAAFALLGALLVPVAASAVTGIAIRRGARGLTPAGRRGPRRRAQTRAAGHGRHLGRNSGALAQSARRQNSRLESAGVHCGMVALRAAGSVRVFLGNGQCHFRAQVSISRFAGSGLSRDCRSGALSSAAALENPLAGNRYGRTTITGPVDAALSIPSSLGLARRVGSFEHAREDG